MSKRAIAAVLGVAVLAVPAVAIAAPGQGKGKGAEKRAAAKAKTVGFVFKGTLAAPGTVEVLKGNRHVRKGGFVGQQVAFDFGSATVVAADVNADQTVDVADVAVGDKVLVKARLAKGTEFEAAVEAFAAGGGIEARKLVNQSRPRAEDDS